jgi:integral membrane sensor domain MASE1
LIARAIAVGVTYAALSKLIVLATAFGDTTGATFWPGAGLTLAVLLRRPRAEWPVYLLAVAVAEASIDLWAGYGVPVAAGWAIANTAEPLAAALVLHRLGVTLPDFGRRGDLARFVGAGIVVGPLIGALVGTAVGALAAGDPWMPRLSRWYVGDAMGVLVIAPALLILWPPARARRGALTSLAILTLLTLVVLGPWSFAAAAGLPFLIVPLLSSIAMRDGLRGAAAGVLVVATLIEASPRPGADRSPTAPARSTASSSRRCSSRCAR